MFSRATYRALQLIREAPALCARSLSRLRRRRRRRVLSFALVQLAPSSLPHNYYSWPNFDLSSRALASQGQRSPLLSNNTCNDIQKMAAATSTSHFQAHGRSSGAPEQRTRPEVLSFEKDLSYELVTLKKLSGKREDHALRQRL